MQKSNSKILKAESNRSEPKGSGTGIKITLPLNAQKCECWRFFNSRACSGNNILIYKDPHTESPSQDSSRLFFIPAKLRIECIHALGRAFLCPVTPGEAGRGESRGRLHARLIAKPREVCPAELKCS